MKFMRLILRPRLWRDSVSTLSIVEGLIFLVFCIFVSGCTHSFPRYRDIMQSAAMVNKSDGIDEKEAVLLAQNMIVKKGLTDRLFSLKPYRVQKKVTWNKNGEIIEFVRPPEDFAYELQETWVVQFRDREGSFFHGLYPIMPFYVNVDAKNGDILKWGLLK